MLSAVTIWRQTCKRSKSLTPWIIRPGCPCTSASPRAILRRGGELLLIRSQKFGEYKFPGGGIEAGENPREAVSREAREEAGCILLPETIRAFGKTIERRLDAHSGQQVFEQISYYFTAEAAEAQAETDMDAYEIEYGYRADWVPAAQAVEGNRELLGSGRPQPPWVRRELFVLELLLREMG